MSIHTNPIQGRPVSLTVWPAMLKKLTLAALLSSRCDGRRQTNTLG